MLYPMYTGASQRLAGLDRRASPWIVGAVRIFAGLLWLANLHWKVPPRFGEDTGGGLFKYSESVTRNSPFAPFTWVTEEIILPNFQLFGWVTLIVEIVIAALLLIGYRTKLIGLVAALWAVPILLSVIYYDRADEWSWAYFMMIALPLLLSAVDAGKHLGLDGLRERGPDAASRGITALGVVTIAVGIVGLIVARSIDFAGRDVALLGSDAGFVDDGEVVRRWELKFLFFNPLWALLTIVFGILLVLGARQLMLARAGAIGLAVIAVIAFFSQEFDYVRGEGDVTTIGTGSNVAFWAAMGLAAALLCRQVATQTVDDRSAASVRAGSPADTPVVE